MLAQERQLARMGGVWVWAMRGRAELRGQAWRLGGGMGELAGWLARSFARDTRERGVDDERCRITRRPYRGTLVFFFWDRTVPFVLDCL